MARLDLLTCVVTALTTCALMCNTLHAEEGATADKSETIVYNYTGTCALKAWMSVAGCRKDFIDRMPGKDETGHCCLYHLIDECAHRGAAKLCGPATDQVKEQYMLKYAVMIGNPDCSAVRLDSFRCIWISWENYISSAIFCLIVLVVIILVIRWYARQTITEAEYRNMNM